MKKIIYAATILLTLAGTGLPVSANVQQDTEYSINENIEVLEVEELAPPAEITTSTDSQLPESKIARKMTQAEKAQNAAVNDSWGGAITIIAMCIVILALAVLSILFLFFGKISEMALKRTKKRAKEAAEHDVDEEHLEITHGEVIAAIALALTEHFGDGHDIEDTILTIRRMQKAYSPWNSKIYNLRTIGDHARNAMPFSQMRGKLQ